MFKSRHRKRNRNKLWLSGCWLEKESKLFPLWDIYTKIIKVIMKICFPTDSFEPFIYTEWCSDTVNVSESCYTLLGLLPFAELWPVRLRFTRSQPERFQCERSHFWRDADPSAHVTECQITQHTHTHNCVQCGATAGFFIALPSNPSSSIFSLFSLSLSLSLPVCSTGSYMHIPGIPPNIMLALNILH